MGGYAQGPARVAFFSWLAQNYCLPPESALQQHQLMFGSKAVSCTRCKDSVRYTAAEHVLGAFVHGSTCVEVGDFTVAGVHPTHRLFKYGSKRRVLCVLQSLRSRRGEWKPTTMHAQQRIPGGPGDQPEARALVKRVSELMCPMADIRTFA